MQLNTLGFPIKSLHGFLHGPALRVFFFSICCWTTNSTNEVVFMEATHKADATLEGETLKHLLELCQSMADMKLGKMIVSD